jgi:hypothetical protein
MIYRLRSELFIAAIRRVSSGRFGRRGRRSPQSFVHDQRMSSVDVAMFDGVHELRDQEPTASAFRQRIFGQIAPSRGRGERPWFRNYHLQIAVPPYPCQPNACTGTGAPAVANCVGEGFAHREHYAFQRLAVRCTVYPQPVAQVAHCRPHVFQSCGNRHAGPLGRADCRWSGRFMHRPKCAKLHSLEQACAHAPMSGRRFPRSL